MSETIAITYCGMGCGKVDLEHFDECEGRIMRGTQWKCKCGNTIETLGGHDTDCSKCGACYNGYGQRLRDNWRGNMSNYDENVSDMDGYELQHANDY